MLAFKYKEKLFQNTQSSEQNASLESVEERTNVTQREISRTTFQLTLQTATLQGEKQLNIIFKVKTSKLTFLTLFGGRVTYSKWVTLTTKRRVKTPICSSGYTSTKTPTLKVTSIGCNSVAITMARPCDTGI